MRRWSWALILLVVAVMLWPARNRTAVSPVPSPAPAAPAPRLNLAGTPIREEPPLRPHPQSQALADQLNAPSADPAQDVVVLHHLILLYQRAMHHRQGTPIGDDVDLARALTGRNPMRQVFIPPTHPALSSDGHIRDRWGTPYFLHARGYGAFEVRSAGPDRKLFTGDDLIAHPPGQGP